MVYRGVSAYATAALGAATVEVAALIVAASVLLMAETYVTCAAMTVVAIVLSVAASQYLHLRAQVRRINPDNLASANASCATSPRAAVVHVAETSRPDPPVSRVMAGTHGSFDETQSLQSSRGSPRHSPQRSSQPTLIGVASIAMEDQPAAPSHNSSTSSTFARGGSSRPSSSSRRSAGASDDRRVVVASNPLGVPTPSNSGPVSPRGVPAATATTTTMTAATTNSARRPSAETAARSPQPPLSLVGRQSPPSVSLGGGSIRSVPIVASSNDGQSDMDSPTDKVGAAFSTSSAINPLKLPPALQAAHDDEHHSPGVQPSSSKLSEIAEDATAVSLARVNWASGIAAASYCILAIIAAAETESPLFLVYLLAAPGYALSPFGFSGRVGLVTVGVVACVVMWLVALGVTSATVTPTTSTLAKQAASGEATFQSVWAATAFASGGVVLGLLVRVAIGAWFESDVAANVGDTRLLLQFIKLACDFDTVDDAWMIADDIEESELREQCGQLLNTVKEAASFAPQISPRREHGGGMSPRRTDTFGSGRPPLMTKASSSGSTLLSATMLQRNAMRPGTAGQHGAGMPSARSSFRSVGQSPGATPLSLQGHGDHHRSRMSVRSTSPANEPLSSRSAAGLSSLSVSTRRRAATHSNGMFAVIVIAASEVQDTESAQDLELLYDAVESATLYGGALLQGASDEMVIMFTVSDNSTHTAMQAVTGALEAISGAADEGVNVTAAVAMGAGTRTVLGTSLRSVRLTGPVMNTARAFLKLGTEIKTGAVYADPAVAQDVAGSHIVLPIDLARLPQAGTLAVYRIAAPLNLPPGLVNEEWMYQLQKITDATPASVSKIRRAFAEFAAGKFASALEKWQALSDDALAAAADIPRLMERCKLQLDHDQAPATVSAATPTATEATVVPIVVGVCEPPTKVTVRGDLVRSQRRAWD